MVLIHLTLWKDLTNRCVNLYIRAELVIRLCLLITVITIHTYRTFQSSTFHSLVTTQTHVVVLEAFVFTLLTIAAHLFSKHSRDISMKQVAFLLSMLGAFGVLFIGALVFDYTEDFGFENAWNFVNVTSLTIGYGNILVTTVAGKIVLITYGNLMLVIVGVLLITLRNALPIGHITKSESLKIGTALLLYWSVGAVAFMLLETWSFLNGLYFVWVTFTTVGYGDLYPTNPWAWEFWLLYVYVGIGIVSYLIGLASDYATR